MSRLARRVSAAFAVVLLVIAFVAVVGVGLAQARPVNDPVYTRADVGVGNPYWSCTYQVRYDTQVCIPRTTPTKSLMKWWIFW